MAQQKLTIPNWQPIKLGIAVPSYGMGNIATRAILDIETCPLVEGRLHYQEFALSVLTLAHNFCWCWAMNAFRRGNITHLLLMHSDIKPVQPHWFELFIEEMNRSQSDALGCFIPIKNPLGYTSTAIDTDEWNPYRIPLLQAKEMPVTWTHPKLLLNTGLWLFNLKNFADKALHFRCHDKIEEVNGELRPFHISEDWDFSRQCRAHGLRLFVTRAVALRHAGTTSFPNAPAWGSPVDTESIMPDEPIIVTDGFGEQVTHDLRLPAWTSRNGNAEAHA